jgi:predicted ATP-grasp superfamily ATP-dependent carboligase
VAKAIVFAQKRLTVSPTLAARLAEGACQSEPPIYADVPAAGATFEPLWPVATVLAQGPNAQYAAAQLMGRVSGLSRSLESSADMAAG